MSKKVKEINNKYIISIILGLCSFIGINYVPVYKYVLKEFVGNNIFYKFFAKTSIVLNGFGIESFIIFIALTYLIYKFYNKEKFNTKHVIAIIFSILTLMGKAVISVDNVDVLYYNWFNFLFSVFSAIGYFTLYKIILDKIFDIGKLKDIEFDKKSRLSKIYNFIFEEHPFIAPLVLMLIMAIPYIIITFPGTVFSDGFNQFYNYFRIEKFTNHHPAISTLFMGGLFSLGRHLFNDSIGVFFVIFVQSIIQLVIFSYVFVFYKKYNINKNFRIFTLLFLMFNSVIKIYMVTVVKDTLFHVFLTLFVIETIEMYTALKDKVTKKHIALYLLSAFLVFAFRNNGIYIVLLSIVSLLFVSPGKKKKLIVGSLFITMFIINILFHTAFLPMMKIKEGNKREALTVPIQQTVRYIKYHYKEMSKEDLDTMQEMFVIPNKKIIKRYNPHHVDKVKSQFNPECDGPCLKKVLVLWFKELADDPKLYVDSFINNYMGYMYPSTNEYYNKKNNLDGLGTFVQYDNKKRVFKYELKNPKTTLMLQEIANTKKQIPVIGLLYSCGFYSWLLIIIVGFLIHTRRYKELVLLVPIIGSWLFLFLGPVDAYFRYVMPLMMPLIIMTSYIANRKEV